MKTGLHVRAWLGLTVAALALAVPTVASAAPGNGKGNDVLYVGKDVKVKKPKKGELPQAAPLAVAAAEAADEFESPPVGSIEDLAADQLRHGSAERAGLHAARGQRADGGLGLEQRQLPDRRLPQRRRHAT